MKRPEREVRAWNAKYPVGTAVQYRAYPGAPPELSVTRTHAEVLGDHTAVVWLEGKAGCVALSALTGSPGSPVAPPGETST